MMLSLLISFGRFGPAFAAPPALRGEPYLRTCEGFLDALRADTVEDFFLRQVKNERQLAQLMVDYRVVFTSDFHAAILLALTRRNVNVRSEAMYRYARALGRTNPVLARTVARRERRLIREVIDQLRLTSARATEVDVARVNHKRTNAFLTAALGGEHRATFERVMGRAIRSVLLTTIAGKPLPPSSVASILISRFGGGFYGFVGGTVVAAYVFMPDHPGFMTFTMFGSAFAAGYYAENLDEAYYARLHGQSAPEDQLTFRGNPVPTAIDLNDDSRASPWEFPLMSLSNARSLNLEAMTPVDLAYLGHLELRALGASELAQISGQNLSDLIALVSARATAVKESPGSPRARIQFAAAINDLRAFIDALPKGDESSLVGIEHLAETIAADVAVIERKLYANRSANLTEENLLKLEIIAEKLNSDLARVSRVRVDRARIRRVFEILEPVARRLGSILETIPRDDAQWDSAAADALVAIDELRLGLTP